MLFGFDLINSFFNMVFGVAISKLPYLKFEDYGGLMISTLALT